MSNRKSICMLTTSAIASDGRVLRQIKYLAQEYDLTVAAYGPPLSDWQDNPHLHYIRLAEPPTHAQAIDRLKKADARPMFHWAILTMKRLGFRAGLASGLLWPRTYDIAYNLRWNHLLRPVHAGGRRYDVYHVHNWHSLPFAAKAARRTGARLFVDLHEYSPMQFDHQPGWWRHKRFLFYILRRYMPQADASTTVAPVIVERYRDEVGFTPQLLLNVPEAIPLGEKKFDPNNIRLVHHGAASPVRKPELMIETIAQCDPRYSLHLMFMPSSYLPKLKEVAQRIAPGRVFFHDPVPPDQIVPKISEFDVGLILLPPITTNLLFALPNKFFESIVAGLAICIGPSPSMQAYVRQYDLGVVAPTFEPADLAATLNAVTAEQWQAMQQATRRAAQHLNAQVEMQKLLEIYDRILN